MGADDVAASVAGAEPAGGQATDEPTYEQRAAHALEVAERLLDEVLPVLRMLTPDGWNMAYFHALGRWHTQDMGLLKEARLLSMRASQKWPPPSLYPKPAARPHHPACVRPSDEHDTCPTSGRGDTSPRPAASHQPEVG